jgi:hypothetical protein
MNDTYVNMQQIIDNFKNEETETKIKNTFCCYIIIANREDFKSVVRIRQIFDYVRHHPITEVVSSDVQLLHGHVGRESLEDYSTAFEPQSMI